MSRPIRKRGTTLQVRRISKRLTQLRRQLDQAQAQVKASGRNDRTLNLLLEDGLNRIGRLGEQIQEQRHQIGLLAVQAPADWNRANFTYVLSCVSADMHAWVAQIDSILKRMQPPVTPPVDGDVPVD